jgi:diguanylate cyclase (GGDEF)-like protein
VDNFLKNRGIMAYFVASSVVNEPEVANILAYRLYERSMGTLYSHGSFCLISVFLLYGLIPTQALLLWAGLLFCNLIVRGLHVKKWLSSNEEQRKGVWMSKMAAITSLINGILWASTVFFLDFTAFPFVSLALTIMVIGLAAGAAVFAAYYIPAFYLAVVPYLGSQILFHLYNFSFQSLLIALILVIFGAMLYGQALQLNKVQRSNVINELENKNLIERLTSANAILKEVSQLDHLTGCFNRRHFDKVIAYMWSRYKEKDQAFGLIAIDLDNFKHLNDTYGHQAGDSALIAATTIFKTHLRQSDVACRFGGDEFSLILPQTNKTQTFEIADRIRHSMQNASHDVNGKLISITASLGVSSSDDATSIDELIQKADDAMYLSKKAGRNKVS